MSANIRPPAGKRQLPLNQNERLLKIMQATPEQQALIDKIMEGAASDSAAMAPPPVEVPRVFEPFIGKEETVKRLDISLRTLGRWMETGLIPFYKHKKNTFFKYSEIEDALKEKCRVARR